MAKFKVVKIVPFRHKVGTAQIETLCPFSKPSETALTVGSVACGHCMNFEGRTKDGNAVLCTAQWECEDITEFYNVDEKLLEEQRLGLLDVHNHCETTGLEEGLLALLRGLRHTLDDWSDKKHFAGEFTQEYLNGITDRVNKNEE